MALNERLILLAERIFFCDFCGTAYRNLKEAKDAGCDKEPVPRYQVGDVVLAHFELTASGTSEVVDSFEGPGRITEVLKPAVKTTIITCALYSYEDRHEFEVVAQPNYHGWSYAVTPLDETTCHPSIRRTHGILDGIFRESHIRAAALTAKQ